MALKIFKLFFYILIWSSVFHISVAYAEGGGIPGGLEPYKQTPADTLVQIAVTVVVLKVLQRFNLP